MSSSRFNQTGPKIGLSVRLAETQAEIEQHNACVIEVFAQELGVRNRKRRRSRCRSFRRILPPPFWLLTTQTGDVIGCYRLITEETAKKSAAGIENTNLTCPL